MAAAQGSVRFRPPCPCRSQAIPGGASPPSPPPKVAVFGGSTVRWRARARKGTRPQYGAFRGVRGRMISWASIFAVCNRGFRNARSRLARCAISPCCMQVCESLAASERICFLVGKSTERRSPETLSFGAKTVAAHFLLYAGLTVGAAHFLLFGCGPVLLAVAALLL